MSAGSVFTGLLGLLGALMVFAGSAAAGGLLAVMTGARERLRGTDRVVAFGAFVVVLIAGGAALTRPEARAAVTAFAIVPLLVGFLMTKSDLRRRT